MRHRAVILCVLLGSAFTAGTGQTTRLPTPAIAVTDTARPAFPPARFYFPEDTAWGVTPPYNAEVRYHRRLYAVVFYDTTSGVRIRQLLKKYQATIIAGWSHGGAYCIRVPDPGPTWAAVDSLLHRLKSESGVDLVFPLNYRESAVLDARLDTASHPVPLVEFIATDDDSARAGPPILENCGYYLNIRGSTGHVAGFGVGAAVQLRGETLAIRIDSYPTSTFVIHDWQMARWKLRIGNLGFRKYRVEVNSGDDRLTRDVTLNATMTCSEVR
jgi:hypothetical protein